VAKRSRHRSASLVGSLIVLLILGVAIRSCIPSRTVGQAAVGEACFAFSRALQLPNGESTYDVFERAQDAASRSADLALAADVSHAVSAYGEDGNRGPVSVQVADGVLAQCQAQGWSTTDPCLFGAAVCATPRTTD
jgi:hypothetical protein